MIYFLLTIATLLTSLVSGVLSMAGGMILMGVFGFFLSVPAAMVLHGVAQAVSNGSRIYLYRRHICLGVLIPYAIGTALVLAGFLSISLVPDKAVVFIGIGMFPFLALALPKSLYLDVERKPVAFICGVLVTTAQMLAGASGPVLDIFYVNSELTRQEVLATKAVTQTLGHIVKLGYYAFFISAGTALPLWLFPAVILAAIIGNWVGSLIVARMHDEQFRMIGRYVIMIIGAIYIGKGIYELIFEGAG
ncbi:MAG: sulfite exporter TauE/SafE family protein [Pseudomonadales bacterium]